ncbi:hypothetical protein ACOSQ3_033400 [Xanthoceras sorbifolium]
MRRLRRAVVKRRGDDEEQRRGDNEQWQDGANVAVRRRDGAVRREMGLCGGENSCAATLYYTFYLYCSILFAVLLSPFKYV